MRCGAVVLNMKWFWLVTKEQRTLRLRSCSLFNTSACVILTMSWQAHWPWELRGKTQGGQNAQSSRKETRITHLMWTVAIITHDLPAQIFIEPVTLIQRDWFRWVLSVCTVSSVIMTFSNPFWLPNNPFSLAWCCSPHFLGIHFHWNDPVFQSFHYFSPSLSLSALCPFLIFSPPLSLRPSLSLLLFFSCGCFSVCFLSLFFFSFSPRDPIFFSPSSPIQVFFILFSE